MSKKSRNLIKLKLKNSTRITFVILAIVLFAISSANIIKLISNSHQTTISEYEIYKYQNDFSSDYTINLKDNQFIKEKTLPSGQTYVSDLINSINMNFNYDYLSSDTSSIDYNYKIDAILMATYNENGKDYTVWNKTYNLKNKDNQKSKGNIEISENVNIDYASYHQEVLNFKQTFGMSINAILYIKLTVNTTANINNEDIQNQYTSDFSITLGDKVAIVNGKLNDTNSDTIKQQQTNIKNTINTPKLVFSFIIMILSIYIIYFIKYKTKKLNSIKNEFRLELNRILKSCQDRIVIVEKQFDNDDENIIYVKDFGELIKLSEELYKPILCWISDDIDNEEACFCIISNKINYRYILKK